MKTKNKDKERIGAPVEIKPISFRPDHKRRPKSFIRMKWWIRIALGIVIILFGASAWFVFTARQVAIQIKPEPDRISIQGGIATPKIGAHYLLRPGEYSLRADKQCYQPLAKRFVVEHAKNQEVNFSMTKLPGRLSFQAHRSDKPAVNLEAARVFIDGKEVGQTPLTELDVISGRRTIEIRAENYQDLQTEMEVEGCGVRQALDLALVPAWSDITVDSIPGKAAVIVDGKSVGSTPLQLELLAGEHKLELKADGFKTWRTRLIVEANQPQALTDIRLQPADGSLTVKTTPSGANVMLGNTFVGQSPVKLELSADTSHLINISKAGYEKATRKVKLDSEESKTIAVTLKAKLGILNFAVEPAGADLYINGKLKGAVPQQLRLVAVEHQIEIKKKGYQTYRTRVTPRPGFAQEIKVTLSEGAAAKRARAGIIRAKNGYELKLVRPQAFTMGSSRRVQGRRSNETLRKVKLQRSFYMGIREVTNKEFRQYLAAHNSGTFKGQSLNRDQLPVVQVTWQQAALFCNWLSAKEALPPAYIRRGEKVVAADPVTTGYRLPTEAEWEYCARFNENKADLKYPWGNKFPPAAPSGNFADVSAKDLLVSYLPTYNDGYPVAAPPAKFKANKLGLFDMGGNAAEWCHDYYSIYSYNAQKVYNDPLGPKGGKHRLIRDSSWNQSGISALRLAYRDYSNTKRLDLGFRICRYAK